MIVAFQQFSAPSTQITSWNSGNMILPSLAAGNLSDRGEGDELCFTRQVPNLVYTKFRMSRIV